MTERFNQTLSRCLAKVINNEQTNWDEKIDTVLMGYRASRQASTKHSPYFMLYQQEMRLPIDTELLAPDNDGEDVDSDSIIENLLQSRVKVFSKAKVNIDEAQKKQKKTYDKKHAIEKYHIGMEVLVENTADKQRKGGKLNPAWLGPYVINKEIGKGVYELRNKKGDIVRNKVNVNRLKLYVQRGEKAEGNQRKREGGDEVVPNQKRQCPENRTDNIASTFEREGDHIDMDGERTRSGLFLLVKF